MKATANDTSNMVTKHPAESSEKDIENDPAKMWRKMSGIGAVYRMDAELKHLLEQDKERIANERKRIELEKRR